MIKIASQVYTVSSGNYKWELTVKENNQNINGNYTSLYFSLKLIKAKADNQSYNNAGCSYVKFIIDGGDYGNQTVYFDLRNSSVGASRVLTTRTVTIYHGNDGKKTVNFKVLHATKISYGDIYVNGSFTLTPIPRASTLTGFSTGTLNIGTQTKFKINAISSGVKHNIYLRSQNSGWYNVGSNLNAGEHTITIPSYFTSYIGKQVTHQAYFRIQTLYNGSVIKDEYSIAAFKIFNQNYDLNISSFYLTGMYNEGGEYIAGETKIRLYYNVTGTLSPASIKFEIRGANSRDITVTNPSRYGYWESDIMKNKGNTTITMIVKDTAGHTTQKSLSMTFYDDSELTVQSITASGVQDTSGAFAVTKDVTFTTKFKASKSRISRVYYRINNDSNRSVYSWNQTSGTFYYRFPRAGIYNVTVIVYDQYNNTASKTVQVCIDESRGDLRITAMYANGYLDNTNTYVTGGTQRITINYYSPYQISNVQIRARGDYYTGWYNLKYPPRGSSNWHQTEAIWEPKFNTWNNIIYVDVRVYDLSGNYVEKTIQLRHTSLIAKNPPKWYFQNNYDGIYIEEGAKMYFQGKSTDPKDYKIFYAKAHTDLFNVEYHCRHYWHYHYGYWYCTRKKLQQLLLDNIDSKSFKKYVFKDFGEDFSNKPMWQNGNKFYMYPKDVDNYYALQFMENVEPGDTILMFAIEREWNGSTNSYVYSFDENSLSHKNMVPMCTLPYDPPELTLGVAESTKNKITFTYKNPLDDTAYNNIDLTFIVDICLIVRDANGKLINGPNPGKRDGKNGRTWVHYSDRKWHHCFTPYGMPMYNFKVFNTTFDLSSYPEDCTVSAIAFYYANYHRFPSVYSTSNIVSVVRQDLDLTLSFVKPTNGAWLTERNPEVGVKVTIPPNAILTNAQLVYEDTDFAANFKASKWKAAPIIFNVNRTHSHHLPHFHMNWCYYHHSYYRYYGWYHALYCPHDWFYDCRFLYRNRYLGQNQRIEAPANTLIINKYKDYRLFLECRSNSFDEARQVDLGDINTFELLQNKTYSFNYRMPTSQGNYLINKGENQLALYVEPYEDNSTDVFYYTAAGNWLTRKIYESEVLLTSNPYINNNMILPDGIDDFARITNNVLEIRIPKDKIVKNKKHKLKYDVYAKRAFHFYNTAGHVCHYPHRILHCYTHLYVCGVWHKHVIYHPPYTHAHGHCVPEIHCGEQWISKEIEFTRTNDDEYVVIKIDAVGLHSVKFRNFYVEDHNGKSVDIGTPAQLNKRERLFQKKITVNYDGYYFDHNYIDPLKADDVHSLRNYLKTISDEYNCGNFVMNGTFNDAHLSYNDFTIDAWKNWGDLKVYKSQGLDGFNDDDTVYLKCPTDREGVSSGIYQGFDCETIPPNSTITVGYTLHDSTNYDHPIEEIIEEQPTPPPVIPVVPPSFAIQGIRLFGGFDGPGHNRFMEYGSLHFVVNYHTDIAITKVDWRITGGMSTSWNSIPKGSYTNFTATGEWFIPLIPVRAIRNCTLTVRIWDMSGHYRTITAPFIVYAREHDFRNINVLIYNQPFFLFRYRGGCWDPETNTTYIHPSYADSVYLYGATNHCYIWQQSQLDHVRLVCLSGDTTRLIKEYSYFASYPFTIKPNFDKSKKYHEAALMVTDYRSYYYYYYSPYAYSNCYAQYVAKAEINADFFNRMHALDPVAAAAIDEPENGLMTRAADTRATSNLTVELSLPPGTEANRYNGCCHNGLFVAGQTALQLRIDVKGCVGNKAEIMIDITGCNEEHEKLIMNISNGEGSCVWTSTQFHCSGYVNVKVSVLDKGTNRKAYASTNFSVYGNCPFNDMHYYTHDYYYTDDTSDYHTRIYNFSTAATDGLVDEKKSLKLYLDGYGWHGGKYSKIELFGANNWSTRINHSNSSDYVNTTVTIPESALQNKGITYIRWTLSSNSCVYDDVTCTKTLKVYVYKTYEATPPPPPPVVPAPAPVIMPPKSEAYLQYIVDGEIDETVKLSDSGGKVSLMLTTRQKHYDEVRIAFTHGGATTSYNRNYLLIVKDVRISKDPQYRYLPTSAELAKQRAAGKGDYYIEARDFNDMADYCYTLFSVLKYKNQSGFSGDPDKFNNIPRAIPEETSKGMNEYSDVTKNYFDDWKQLIDTIKDMSRKK